MIAKWTSSISVARVLAIACTAALLSGCSLANPAQTMLGEPGQIKPVAQCVQNNAAALRLLWQANYPGMDYVNIYTHPCSGGIYLIDPQSADRNIQLLWQGWWLQGLYRPTWDNTQSQPTLPTLPTLQLTGKFITGTGPIGSQSFFARVSARLTSTGWQIQEPQTDLAEPSPPTIFYSGGRRLFEIHNAEQLTGLGLAPEDWPVDFAAERLVVMNADLHSSSEAVVKRSATTYFLEHRTTRIVSAYTVTGLIWMVVSRDDRSIAWGRDQQADDCTTCRSGASRHPHVRWYVAARAKQGSPAYPGKKPGMLPGKSK